MDTFVYLPMTPEQIAAVRAGNGFAKVQDPSTHRVYFLIEESVPTISDEYVRRKVDEAYAEGNLGPLDMEAVKSEFRRRQSSTP